jgi:DUF4097 and DUF4098 domain-containing protein YvlB
MKKIMLLFLTVCFAGFAFAQETIEKEFKVAMGKRLDLNLKTGGSVEISGWDKELLTAKVYLDGRDWEDCKVDFKETSSGVQIHSSFIGKWRNHSTDVRCEIKVPKRFDLEIQTMGGEVSIMNVEGEISGKTMGGKLQLSGLKGKIDLTTMGGNITLTSSDLDGKVHTMGGQVLLQDVKGSVKGSSMGGNVIYKNVTNREGKSTGEEVRISTMGGDINVDDAPAGAEVHTMGGDINIRRAAQFVKAKTMGGDIDIDAIDGWVQATTMGGDVTVTMVGDPEKGRRDVELVSMGGDITLTVPAGLSMEFDIELAYTKESRRNYKIINDFEMQQETSKEWTYERGSPRKYIYGTGSVAGGKNKIRIETINGNVYVKKGK